MPAENLHRRSFLMAAGAPVLSALLPAAPASRDIAAFERPRVLRNAAKYIGEKPVTITASHSPRSSGGTHDFFSEGDYWWPDAKNPDGPYVQRDGMTNPDNFVAHRQALMRISVQMPALAAAWHLTREKRYAENAAGHLRAWFVDEKTRMNPNLQFAQAIHGRTPGRGTGVTDTIHLVEVAQAVPFVAASGALSPSELAGVKAWLADYIVWMTTSANGMEERDTKNNHAMCWGMQVAAFAKLTGNAARMDYVRERYKSAYLPNQEAPDGSFPLELARTKPYGYSLFNLEAMVALCQILSEPRENLLLYARPDGRGAAKAIEYLYPFIADKTKWPKPQAALLFGGLAFNKPEYIETWKKLPADSEVEEVVRNFFIRQPVLWIGA